MGRRPCCEKEGVNRGAWTAMEDKLLTDHISLHGEGRWRSLPKIAGLNRCGKSCRLRWLNYLRPDIKRGNITDDEEELIIRLHKLLGNRWSLIAGRLPGRTDNEIKNYWNSNLSKKINRGEDLRNVDANQNDTKKDTNSRPVPQKLRETESSHSANPVPSPHSVVFRTKAFKCTRRVRLTSPPPPPPPPLSYTPDPADTEAMGAGHTSLIETPVMDLPTMDFSMNLDEFFGPQPLPPLAEVGSDLVSPETGSGGGDEFSPAELPAGVFSDEMLEDWTRDDQCAFDASFLETWLGV